MKNILLLFLLVICFSCVGKSKEELFVRDSKKIIEELKIMLDNDQKGRIIISKLKKSSDSIVAKKKIDSIWNIQNKADIVNTKRLIYLTKKYGFPNVDRLKEPIAAWIIFQHTPEDFKEEVKILLEEEDKFGRMPKFEYQMLKWHLSGRKGIPSNLNELNIEAKNSVE